MSEYKKYLHVERLGSEECKGLLDNDAVYVTAKVDGSNDCVYWSEKAGGVMVGSRNFELSDAEDNAYLRQTRGALQRTSQGARKGKWAIARVCNRGSWCSFTTSKDKKARFRGLWNSNGGMYET